MIDDDNYVIGRDGKPTRIIRDGGKVKVGLTMMDAETVAARQAYFADNAWHRPGFRTSNIRTAARDDINSVYAEYDRAKGEEWRSPESALARAKETGAEAGPMKGNSDPDTPEYRAQRRKQSAAPFVERGQDDAKPKRGEWEEEEEDDPGDDDKDCSGRDAHDMAWCPTCRGSGVVDDPDDDEDDDVDTIVRRTQTGTESIQRRDVPDSRPMNLRELQADHKAILNGVYQQEDERLRNAWRNR
jgi:hypothetical protein